MFVLVILAYIIIALIEITPLIKQKKKKELILYSTLLSFSFVLSLLLSFGVEIPSPAKFIEKVVIFFIG